MFKMGTSSIQCGEEIAMQSKLLSRLPLWPTSSPRRDKDSAIVFKKPVYKNQGDEMVRMGRGFTIQNC